MFKKFNNEVFECLNKQHNIFVLVGNGFDISILKKYKKGRMSGKATSYIDFYDYITYYNLSNDSNILYKKMKEGKDCEKENWSDFENIISRLINKRESTIEEIKRAMFEFQGHFTMFLNELVDSDTLLELNKDASEKSLSKQSLGEFLKDLDDSNKFKFTEEIYHYDLFYYVVANFNYTSLLDNYLYLDKLQFDPHWHRTVDTNFYFKPKLNSNNESNPTEYSSYILTDIIHPHGIQDIPRSILFGIDLPEYDKGNSKEKELVKGYWSQYDTKYKSYMEEAELFIIYGMSLGVTDAWWMDQIFEAISERGAELIIYRYGSESEDSIKELFIDCCIRHKDYPEEKKNEVKNNIYVVIFENNDTYFLGLEDKNCNILS